MAVDRDIRPTGFVTKRPCVGQNAWDRVSGRWVASACYTDVAPLFFTRHLDTGTFPYVGVVGPDGRTDYFEYPVLTGLWAWLVSRLTAMFGGEGGVLAYFTVSSVLLAAVYLAAVVMTSRLTTQAPWRVMIMCASPLLLVHAFTNWDILPIFLTSGALLAWARKRPVTAGILIGLGAAAKLYPVFLLGALLVLCLRAGALRDWVRATVAALGALVVINLPILLAYPDGWGEFLRLNAARSPEWNSIYFLAEQVTGRHVPAVNLLSILGFTVSCLLIAWLALRAQRRPRLAQVALLVTAAFLLTNKVWSPQYSLWLLPLAVLAAPRWWPMLAWQFSEVLVWVALTPHLGAADTSGIPLGTFLVAALLRDICLLWIVGLVIRDILLPARDPVRVDGRDDPAGGSLDGAYDVWVLKPKWVNAT